MNHAQTTRAYIYVPCITLRLLHEVKSRNVTTFPCDILLRALRHYVAICLLYNLNKMREVIKLLFGEQIVPFFLKSNSIFPNGLHVHGLLVGRFRNLNV